MSFRATLRIAGLIAISQLAWSPALAQNNPPAGAFYAGEPPVSGPMQGGMPRQDWLIECTRRLNNNPGMATTDTGATCERWWAFYQAGGAPHPVYGYAVPVSVTETTEDCPDRAVETRVLQRKIIKRRVIHDKRVKI